MSELRPLDTVKVAEQTPDVIQPWAELGLKSDEYAQLGDVAWLFALEGTMFAALQILVYDTIAGQSHASLVLWLGSAVVAGIAIALIGGVTGLVTLVTVVAVVAALVTGLVPRTSDTD